MGKQRYKNPPVIEALCEIFFKNSQWDDAIPGLFFEKVRDRFPKRRNMKVVQAEVRFEPSGNVDTSVKQRPARMQFLSESEKQLVQVGQEVLVVNQLAPYPNFEEWEPLIYSTLEAYRELARPSSPSIVGMRYINQIRLPGSRVELQDFCTLYPQVPKSMTEHHGAFLLRVDLAPEIPDEELLVTFASSPTESKEEFSFLLDIYAKIHVPDGCWGDDLRILVRRAQADTERVFESCITDRLRQQFGMEN